MNLLIARLNRVFRVAAASLALTALLISVCLADGWSNAGGPPKFSVVAVTTSEVLYADGSTLTPDGTYTTGGVAYSVPAATVGIYGDLDYSDGTILYPDGSWTSSSH